MLDQKIFSDTAISNSKSEEKISINSILDKKQKGNQDYIFEVNSGDDLKNLTLKVSRIFFDNKDCTLININDVTTELKLQKAHNKNEILKILQSSVSHNVRSPISSISYLASVLQKRVKDLDPEL